MAASRKPRRKALVGLQPQEYEHPWDRAALNVLDKVPGVDKLYKWYSKHMWEKVDSFTHLGSGVRVGPDAYPDLYGLFDSVCATLNLPVRPPLYIERMGVNAFASGIENPVIILSTELIDALDDDELVAVIGHEVGHIKSQHQLYRMMASSVLPMLAVASEATRGITEMIGEVIQGELLNWSRMSELTCDRAGLLACQDLDAATRVQLKLAGLPMRYYKDMNLDAFIAQIATIAELDHGFMNKMARSQADRGLTHPWAVIRTAELRKWVDCGDYQRVLDRETGLSAGIVEERGVQTCATCHSKLDGSEQFCPECGAPLRVKEKQSSSAGRRS